MGEINYRAEELSDLRRFGQRFFELPIYEQYYMKGRIDALIDAGRMSSVGLDLAKQMDAVQGRTAEGGAQALLSTLEG